MLPRRKDDAEDVALMALDSFFRAFEKGRYPELAHRDDFWRLLLKITERKAISLLRRETSQRRGKGRVRGDSALNNLKPVGPQTFVPDPEPGPELAMVMADQIEHLLEQLDDPRLKGIALAKMEGSTTSEMASRFQWSRSSVHRCVRLIRSIWEEELRNESAF
jgi:DNA-directed RNA polymerase specialized sigma24 family protein